MVVQEKDLGVAMEISNNKKQPVTAEPTVSAADGGMSYCLILLCLR